MPPIITYVSGTTVESATAHHQLASPSVRSHRSLPSAATTHTSAGPAP
jgi:hypothetical protein